MSTLPILPDEQHLKGRRVLLRLDLNVPVAGGAVVNDFRILKALPTIDRLRLAGAKTIILSHIGRDPEASLEPVWKELNRHSPVRFIEDIFAPDAANAVAGMQEGEVLLFENLRRWPGEKENDSAFSAHLASFGDMYVNDAFAVSHRSDASVAGLPALLPSFAGPWFMEEVKHLGMALDPPHPFLFVLGGAKFETKIPLLKKFLDIADHVFVAGALMNDFFKAKGYEIGQSVVSGEEYGLSAIMNHTALMLPHDVTAEAPEGSMVKAADAIAPGERIVDVGPESLRSLEELANRAKFILWNAPLGDYEHGYRQSSESLARTMAAGDAATVVGGGDTLAVIGNLGLDDRFTFISTAGGAMLEFLHTGTLPGIEALRAK
jgi:phosphoglycerate kinase